MYTYVTIQWADDGTVEDVIIKADDEFDEEHDEAIFFYGLSRRAILQCYKEKTLCEGEWYIIEVGETYDEI